MQAGFTAPASVRDLFDRVIDIISRLGHGFALIGILFVARLFEGLQQLHVQVPLANVDFCEYSLERVVYDDQIEAQLGLIQSAERSIGEDLNQPLDLDAL